MINLLEITANKRSKDYILSKISNNDIMQHFYGKQITVGLAIKSPLREEANPSFIFYLNKKGDLIFIDFGAGNQGGAFDFVMLLYNASFIDAIDIILSEFNLLDDFKHSYIKSNIIYNKDIIIKERASIGFKSRSFTKDDILYWNTFGIKLKTLKHFNVFPIKYIFSGKNSFKADRYSYVYLEKIKGVMYIKIYQPYSNKTKWLSNMASKVLFGYTKIPNTGNLLIITKALKEIMSLYDTVNIPAIGVQQENIIIKEAVLNNLKNRFSNIITMFDNDKQGISLYLKYKELGINGFIFEEAKNYSDLIQEIGVKRSKQILIKKIIQWQE